MDEVPSQAGGAMLHPTHSKPVTAILNAKKTPPPRLVRDGAGSIEHFSLRLPPGNRKIFTPRQSRG
jgi:hypothetical protein